VTKVHPADSENRPPGLPKTVKKKTYTDISRFNPLAPGLPGPSGELQASGVITQNAQYTSPVNLHSLVPLYY